MCICVGIGCVLGAYICIIRRNFVNHLGTQNVRRINGTAKREEVADVFSEGKFKRLSFTETKLEGNGEVSWWGVNGIIASTQEMEKAREGLAILLKDVWHSAGIDFGCVSPRIFCIKFKFSRVKVCMGMGYGPNEGDSEERNKIWNDMDRILDIVGN